MFFYKITVHCTSFTVTIDRLEHLQSSHILSVSGSYNFVLLMACFKSCILRCNRIVVASLRIGGGGTFKSTFASFLLLLIGDNQYFFQDLPQH